MKKQNKASKFCCSQMRRALKSGETGLVHKAKFREFGLVVRDGGSSYVTIQYCPWCGHALPASLRIAWLRAIADLGFEPGDEQIPAKYLDDRWYRGGKKRGSIRNRNL